MKKYDIFLFDADDTLYDHDKAESAALSTMFARYGFDYSEEVRMKYRKINAQVWAEYQRDEISEADFPTSRYVRLFELIGVQCDDVHAFNEQYLVEMGKGAQLIDGAQEICREIVAAGKQIFIVTNGLFAVQQSRIKNSLISDCISDYFVSSAVGYRKPQIEFFEHVFSHIPPIDKSKIIVIGDSLSADIAGGNNAGIDTCWINPQKSANGSGIVPTYEIHALDEVRKFI